MDVDICLTTIAARVGRVHLVLSSLLDQRPQPARIILHISNAPWLLDDGIAALPDALARLHDASGGRLALRHVPNTGPYRKILPWLADHFGSNRLVVTADDDTIYPQGWLAALLAGWQPGLCVAHTAHSIVVRRGGGLAPYGQWLKAPPNPRPILRLPIGKDGVLYRAADFPPEVLDTDTALRLAPTGDDLWLRWHLARQGIGVAVTGRSRLPAATKGASLWDSYNRGGGNDATIARLEAHFAASYGFTMAGQGPA